MFLFSAEFSEEIKKLVHLAWPLLIAQLTQTLMGVSDTIMAGRYSSIDMAAIAVGVSISLPILIFVQGICLALSPIVSHIDGAKKHHLIAEQVKQMLYLSSLIAGLSLILIDFLPSILALIEMDPQLQAKSLAYLQFVLWALPGFAVYQTLRNYCEGLSLTRPTMIIMVIGLVINIPANLILIYGLFGFPELGGVGCGLATMLVYYIMAVATLIYVKYSNKLKHINLFSSWCYPNLKILITQFKMGLPIAFTLLFEVTLFAMVALLLAPFGAEVVAAHQVTINVSSLIFMIPLSIGLAVAIRVGFLLGEGHTHQAKTAYQAALFLGLGTVFITATLLLYFKFAIANLYSNDVAVIEGAAYLMMFAAMFQFSDSVQVISAHSLRGYKDTKAMFVISFISYWGIGFPIGIVLGLTDIVVDKMAAAGFWIGFICGLSVAAALMFARLKFIQVKLGHISPNY